MNEFISGPTAGHGVTPTGYHGAIPPQPFDLRVSLLPPDRAASVIRMVMDKNRDPEFSIDAMIVEGEMWIDPNSLVALMPSGHMCLSEDADCCNFTGLLIDRSVEDRRKAGWAAAEESRRTTPKFPLPTLD